MRLEFHAAAVRDAGEILDYDKQEAGAHVAERFLHAYRRQLASVAENPSRFSPYPPQPKFRRAFIAGFPHIILFRMKTESVRILVVKHQRRNPQHGQSRW